MTLKLDFSKVEILLMKFKKVNTDVDSAKRENHLRILRKKHRKKYNHIQNIKNIHVVKIK